MIKGMNRKYRLICESRFLISSRSRARATSSVEFLMATRDRSDERALPPGHDAWVIGAESVVVIDITGMATYAKPG